MIPRGIVALLAMALALFAAGPALAQTDPSVPPAAVDPTATSDPFHGPLPFATAQCRDGWFSFSQVQIGTCDGHRGVLHWITEPGVGCNLPSSQAQTCSTTFPSACDVLASRVEQGTAHPDPRCSSSVLAAAPPPPEPPPPTPSTPTGQLLTAASGTGNAQASTFETDDTNVAVCWNVSGRSQSGFGPQVDFIIRSVDLGEAVARYPVSYVTNGMPCTHGYLPAGTYYVVIVATEWTTWSFSMFIEP